VLCCAIAIPKRASDVGESRNAGSISGEKLTREIDWKQKMIKKNDGV
jgi:hypothetical protein